MTLQNLKRNLITLLVFMTCFSNLSCAVQVKKIKPNRTAFALVKVVVNVKVPECVDKNKKEKDCVLKDLGTKAALGSGTFFTYKGKSAFISAGHVCLGPAYGVWSTLPDNSQVKTKITLRSYTGHIVEGKIVYVNLENDFCILEAKHPKNIELPKVSILKPIKDDEFYAISAPASIFDTGMVPVVEGKYQGDSMLWSFYTISTAAGASGAPIYNKQNRIVGVIQRTNSIYNDVALSIKWGDLTKLLNRYDEIVRENLESIIE